MAETIEAGRSQGAYPRLYYFLMTRAGRVISGFACALAVLVVVVGTYFSARLMGDYDLKVRSSTGMTQIKSISIRPAN